jgi:hypothetical protein
MAESVCCARCEYDLSGQDWSRGVARCPECGAANERSPVVRAYRPWPSARRLYGVLLAPTVALLAVHTLVGVVAPVFTLVSGFWATVVVFAWPFFYANLAAAVREPPATAKGKVATLALRGIGLNMVVAAAWLVIAGWLGA